MHNLVLSDGQASMKSYSFFEEPDMIIISSRYRSKAKITILSPTGRINNEMLHARYNPLSDAQRKLRRVLRLDQP